VHNSMGHNAEEC
jgi:hypothetical protein